MANEQQQLAFIDKYQGLAQSAGNELSINSDIPLAQWALETGWGTADYMITANNLGGIMAGPNKLWGFKTLDQFLAVYVNSMRRDCPVLRDGQSHLSDTATEIFTGSSYNPNPNYGAEVESVVQSIANLHQTSSQPEQTKPTTLADLAEHYVGFWGPNWEQAQHLAATLWDMGIR